MYFILRLFEEINSKPYTASLRPCNATIKAPIQFCEQKSPLDSVFRFTVTSDIPATICCELGTTNLRAKFRVLRFSHEFAKLIYIWCPTPRLYYGQNYDIASLVTLILPQKPNNL